MMANRCRPSGDLAGSSSQRQNAPTTGVGAFCRITLGYLGPLGLLCGVLRRFSGCLALGISGRLCRSVSRCLLGCLSRCISRRLLSRLGRRISRCLGCCISRRLGRSLNRRLVSRLLCRFG